MNNFDYKNLTPFKWFVLENFPFIEADFDAIDNWQLFCKLGKKINKIIDSINILGSQVEDISQFFDNLDVQEEINNKLDDMAERGELTEIIAQYLNLAGLLCFNTVSNMKSAENLSDGSFVKTFGKETYNDGKGKFYKIRSLLNTDVIDEVNIIALTNYPTLIAELISDDEITSINQNIDEIETSILNIETNITDLEKPFEHTIFIGDSYARGYWGTDNQVQNWVYYLVNKLGITDYYKFAENGAGFVKIGDDGHTFKTLLEANLEEITDTSKIKNIIVCGGYNDKDQYRSTINTALSDFISYCNLELPNAKIYIGAIGNSSLNDGNGSEIRTRIFINVLPIYKYCTNYDAIYLNGVENILKNYTYYTDDVDTTHPNQDGQGALANGIYQALLTGNCEPYYVDEEHEMTLTNTDLNTADTTFTLTISKYGAITNILIPLSNVVYSTSQSTDGGYDVLIGKLESNYIKPNQRRTFFETNITVTCTQGTINCQGLLWLNDDGNLYIRCYAHSNDSLTGLTGITNIRFSFNQKTIPNIYT